VAGSAVAQSLSEKMSGVSCDVCVARRQLRAELSAAASSELSSAEATPSSARWRGDIS